MNCWLLGQSRSPASTKFVSDWWTEIQAWWINFSRWSLFNRFMEDIPVANNMMHNIFLSNLTRLQVFRAFTCFGHYQYFQPFCRRQWYGLLPLGSPRLWYSWGGKVIVKEVSFEDISTSTWHKWAWRSCFYKIEIQNIWLNSCCCSFMYQTFLRITLFFWRFQSTSTALQCEQPQGLTAREHSEAVSVLMAAWALRVIL